MATVTHRYRTARDVYGAAHVDIHGVHTQLCCSNPHIPLYYSHPTLLPNLNKGNFTRHRPSAGLTTLTMQRPLRMCKMSWPRCKRKPAPISTQAYGPVDPTHSTLHPPLSDLCHEVVSLPRCVPPYIYRENVKRCSIRLINILYEKIGWQNLTVVAAEGDGDAATQDQEGLDQLRAQLAHLQQMREHAETLVQQLNLEEAKQDSGEGGEMPAGLSEMYGISSCCGISEFVPSVFILCGSLSSQVCSSGQLP